MTDELEEEEEEIELRTWGPEEVRMFHNIKNANLVNPWNAMVERTVRCMEIVDNYEDPEGMVNLIQHVEILCLHAIDDRREAFDADYKSRNQDRGGHPYGRL